MCRLVVYREPIVFGMGCLPAERLQINLKNIVTITGQRVNVVISQPKLAVRTTEAVLVVDPVEEEVNRIVHTSLEDLRHKQASNEEVLQITGVESNVESL